MYCVVVAPLVCFGVVYYRLLFICFLLLFYFFVCPFLFLPLYRLLFLAASYHHSPFNENMTRRVGVLYYKSCYNEDNHFTIGNNNTDVFRRLYVCFLDRYVCFCPFSFGHCVICPFSIYGLLLPL